MSKQVILYGPNTKSTHSQNESAKRLGTKLQEKTIPVFTVGVKVLCLLLQKL